jgi:hypothetical protein
MKSLRIRVVVIAALSLGALFWSGSLLNGPVAEPASPAAPTTQLQVAPPDAAQVDVAESLSPSELRAPPELPIPPIQEARRI